VWFAATSNGTRKEDIDLGPKLLRHLELSNSGNSRCSDMVDVAGLDDRLTFHSLRHTTGAWLVSEGVPLKVVQAILGHSTQRVTKKYAHLAPDSLGTATEKTFGK